MAIYIDGKKQTGVTVNYAISCKGMERAPFEMKSARAFTVKPAWGWLIMKGIKDIENRSISVLPPCGTCVVTFSKSYSRYEHKEILDDIPAKYRKRVPEYEVLRELCGKAIGIVDYDVLETSKSIWYYEGNIPWRVSNPRWFQSPFYVTGFVGMWKMKPADARKAWRAMGEIGMGRR